MQKYIIIIISLLVLYPALSYADQDTGSVKVDVKYTNGDRADNYGMVLKIYQDFNKTPYKIIESIPDNPYNITSLPLGHKYTVEAYVNSMYASVGYVNLQTSQESLDMTIPLSGGIRFNVFFKDGVTPLHGATILIKSYDGKQWGERVTDDQGNTQRLWIQSTIRDSDYYIADIILGDGIKYTYSPVKLPSGSYESKVVTPWPFIVNDLITAYVYNATYKVTKFDGTFVVELYNSKGIKVAESPVNMRGEAFFSNLKVDTYDFSVKKIDNTTRQDWGSKKATITDGQKPVEIFRNIETTNEKLVSTKTNVQNPITSCNCVSFRLDNVQDYWLNNVQLGIMNTFQKKNADLTIGIISTAFGDDLKFINFLKDKMKSNPKIEIANSGFEFKNFTSYSPEDQASFIQKSNEKISAALGVTPSVLIFPYGEVKSDILSASSKNKITHLSASISTDKPPYPLSNSTLYRFPVTVSTSDTTNDGVIASIKSSLSNYGFAVIRLNFQNYAINNDNNLKNEVDVQQIQQLESLIDKIRDSDLKIVAIGKINSESDKITIPIWIKNNAKWWSDGKISDQDFIRGIQYMMSKKIIVIQNLPLSEQSKDNSIPIWIKNNAKWWSDGKISDQDFSKGIEFLVKEGIIKVNITN